MGPKILGESKLVARIHEDGIDISKRKFWNHPKFLFYEQRQKCETIMAEQWLLFIMWFLMGTQTFRRFGACLSNSYRWRGLLQQNLGIVLNSYFMVLKCQKNEESS